MSKQVINLAVEISKARDSEVPLKLLKVAEILSTADNPTVIRAELFKYDILKVISISLKHEYGHMKNGWSVAVDLLKIFSDCVNGFEIDDKNFKNDLIPNAAQNILILARKFQEKHMRSKGLSDEYLVFFKNVLRQFSTLHSHYPFIIVKSSREATVFELLITDELETSTIVMHVIRELFAIQINIVHKIDEKTLITIIDEVIYKLTTTDIAEVAQASIQLLLQMCKQDHSFNKLLNRRYKGLKMLLSKWYGKGIGRELAEFTQMLDSADQVRSVDERDGYHATLIQKTWRGYKARKTLKKADKTFSKFQKSYRLKKQEAEELKMIETAQNELKFQVALQHCRKLRKRNLTLAELMRIVPANEIEKYLQRQRNEAATLIQANFRGYMQRKQFYEKREYAEQYRAAVCIQRAIRRWLNRLRKRQLEPPFYSRPPGLSPEKREELLDQIRARIESLPPHPRSTKEVVDLHDNAQKTFQDYVYAQKAIRKQQQQIEVSLALVNHDSDLIINCPRLSEVTEDDIDNYYSHKSLPVMLAAKEAHKQALKKHRAKWYELLMNESESDEENDNIEFSNLINIYDQFTFNNLNKKPSKHEHVSQSTVVPKSERDKLKTNTFRKAATLSWLEGYEND